MTTEATVYNKIASLFEEAFGSWEMNSDPTGDGHYILTTQQQDFVDSLRQAAELAEILAGDQD